jgi:hypothetical protein
MKPDTEYQLTPKGAELAKKMADKNTDVVVEVDKIKKKMGEGSVTEQTPADESDYEDDDIIVPTGRKMSYQYAAKVRKKSFGQLLAEQEGGLGQSFKKAVSLKTEAKVKGIKQKLDPMNMVKFMTFGSNFAPAMLGKLTGRSKEDISQFTGAKYKEMGAGGDTATKVGALAQDTAMLDILMKIYTLMDTNHKEDIRRKEESANYAEEIKLEKEKKRKELLANLKGKKNDKEEKTTEKLEEDTGMGVGGILGSILNAAGGLSSVLRLASVFMGPVGLALMAGTGIGLALVGLMSLAGEESHEQANKTASALNPATEGQAIMDTVRDTSVVERRKQNLLADRPWSKKSLLPWKDPELQQDYLKEIGFDEDTGLTKAEKDQGFTGLNEKGIPIKKESATDKTTPVATSSPSTASQTESTTVTPTESPNAGQKLNAAVKENMDMNLPDSTPDPSTLLSSSVTTLTSKSQNKFPIPAVRNNEETFQRMILNSTRVV